MKTRKYRPVESAERLANQPGKEETMRTTDIKSKWNNLSKTKKIVTGCVTAGVVLAIGVGVSYAAPGAFTSPQNEPVMAEQTKKSTKKASKATDKTDTAATAEDSATKSDNASQEANTQTSEIKADANKSGGSTTKSENKASGDSSTTKTGTKNNNSGGSSSAAKSETKSETKTVEPEKEKRWVVDQAAWDEPVYEEQPVYTDVRVVSGSDGSEYSSLDEMHAHASAILNAGGPMISWERSIKRVQTGTQRVQVDTIHHAEVGHWE